MPFAAAAVAVGAGVSLYAASQQAGAAEDAANAQLQGSQESVAEQRRQYDLTRADFAPWRDAGKTALGQLGGLTGLPGYDKVDFTASPGYQFRMDEGTKAIDRSAAARGMLRSGPTLKALDRYSQGLASDEYTNQFNRLAAISGIGQTATNSTAAAGAGAANNISNALTQAGQARASSYIGQANAYANGAAGVANSVNGGVSNYLLMSYLNK
jgi:hypothetical protein